MKKPKLTNHLLGQPEVVFIGFALFMVVAALVFEAASNSTHSGIWRFPVGDERAFVSRVPLVHDGRERIKLRAGQSWEWVTNDRGEWLYRQREGTWSLRQ